MTKNLQYTDLSGEKTIDVLRLIRSENVGPVTFFQLVSFYGNVEKAIDALPELARRGGRKKPIKIYDYGKAEQELEQIVEHGARVVIYGNESYPALLTEIHDPPPLISVMGNHNILKDKDAIAVIGSRNASANGCRFTQKISREIGEQGFVVTSGLARGIDAFAHTGAIETGTIAVIAGGIDNIYPQENKNLYAEIAEKGLIISESPFGTAPQNKHFPRRNRIISGISKGVLVVEASRKSGSLLTANFALDQGRDVFAVPGSPMDPRCGGTNYLLKQGAVITESVSDILDNLSQNIAAIQKPAQRRLFEEDSGEFEQEFIDIENIEHEITNHDYDAKILDKISVSPISADDIAKQTGVPIKIILTILLEKELAGMIQRHGDGKISRIY